MFALSGAPSSHVLGWGDEPFVTSALFFKAVCACLRLTHRARTPNIHRHGIRGLVIDPYNELEQQRGSQSETEYISAMLSKVRASGRVHQPLACGA